MVEKHCCNDVLEILLLVFSSLVVLSFLIPLFKSKTCLRYFVVSLGKTLYNTFPCWVVLASSSKFIWISIKFQADSYILASPQAGWGNCLPYVLASLTFLRVRRINGKIK